MPALRRSVEGGDRHLDLLSCVVVVRRESDAAGSHGALYPASGEPLVQMFRVNARLGEDHDARAVAIKPRALHRESPGRNLLADLVGESEDAFLNPCRTKLLEQRDRAAEPNNPDDVLRARLETARI